MQLWRKFQSIAYPTLSLQNFHILISSQIFGTRFEIDIPENKKNMKKFIITVFAALGFTFATKAQDLSESLANDVIQSINLNAQDASELKAIYKSRIANIQKIQTGEGTTQQKKQKAALELAAADSEIKTALPADKYAAYKAYMAKKSPISNGANTPKNTVPTAQQAEAFKQALMKEMNITSDQADKVIKMTLEHKTKEKAIKQSNKGNAPAIKAEMQKLNVETVTNLRTVLSDEQIQKLYQLQQQYK